MERLPDFFILGGMRCGSTTLANLLNTHASIYIPKAKELHYFDRRNPAIQSLDAYQGQFSRAGPAQLIADATPDYLSTRGCMERIYRAVPQARFVIILRDPVARAWSHYRFSVATQREIEPFEQALNLESERLAHPIHEHDIYFSYAQRSRYIEHINHYLSRFCARQFHVLLLEELNLKPQVVLEKLFAFLQLDLNSDWQQAMRITNQASLVNIQTKRPPDQLQHTKWALNRTTAKLLNARPLSWLPYRLRNRLYRQVESGIEPSSRLEQGMTDRLQRYFLPYNRQLEDFLGRELPW